MVVLTSFSPPTEGIRHEQPSTKLIINGREIGTGTIYIAESKLAWRNNSTGEGFSLLYPHIAIHAVSRDIERFGSECFYIMVDTCLDDNEMNGEVEENEVDTEGMTEMRFVPDDKGQLDAMFQAMTYCQSQHPPEGDELSEDEFVDADENEDQQQYGDPFAGGDSNYSDTEREGSRPNGHVNEDMDTDGQFQDAEDEN